MILVAPSLFMLLLILFYSWSAPLAALISDHSDSAMWLQMGVATMMWLLSALLLKRFVLLSLLKLRASAPSKLVIDLLGVLFFALAILGVIAFVFDQPVTGLLATSGFMVAVIGFALQGMISDLFSGLALNLERPFKIGDWIEVDGNESGKIVEINWRATRLVTINGESVVVPNGMLSGHKFINFNTPERHFRVNKTICVDYSVPPERAVAILSNAAEGTDGVLKEPKPVVWIKECTDRGVLYIIHFWVADSPNQFPTSRAVLTNVLNHLNQAGIYPAMPKRDVVIERAPVREIVKELDTEALLRRTDLFRNLGDVVLERLLEVLQPTEMPAESDVVSEGDAGSSLFIIVMGRLEVTQKGEDGKARHLAVLWPGAVFGEMSLLTGMSRSATVSCITAATLIEVRKAHLEPILRQYPEVANTLSEMQAQRHAHTASLGLTPEEEERAKEVGVVACLKEKMLRFFGI